MKANYDYNYYDAMTENVKTYMAENADIIADFYDSDTHEFDIDGLNEKLNEDLWVDDSVTGNASGSYFCNAYKAEMCIAHNWQLLSDAIF